MRIQAAIIILLLLTGCSAMKEAGDAPSDRLKEYEASFNPSDYNQPLKDFFSETRSSVSMDSSSASTSHISLQPELIQGYRVQVFSTTNYEEAIGMKAAVEDEFAEQWFYLVYDAPTYKLRAGNFIERYEADRFARSVAENGYRDAWVVPERVFKDPPPRTTPPQEVKK